MKIRMKLKIEGTRDGVAWPDAGGVVDLPKREAVKMCDAGYAVPVKDDKVEKAVATEPEVRSGSDGHVCDVCGQEAKSKAGLAAHKRSHDES